MTRSGAPIIPLAAVGLVTIAVADVFPTHIDLTREGAAVRNTAQAVLIDTRTFLPQVRSAEAWTGPVRLIHKHLPAHGHDASLPAGPPNDIPLGELTDARRGAPGALFPGIDQTPWTPPDPTIAVGPKHIVQTVNMEVAFYSKAGELQFKQRLDSTGDPGFFEGLGAGGFTFDPKCFYDHDAGRFVVLALEVYDPPGESWIDIAVSDDSDPHGIWYKYRTWSVVEVSSSKYWVDYPGLGYDPQGYYVTGNLFKLGGWGGAGSLFRIFEKEPMLTGQPVTFTDLRDGARWSVQVAHCHGTPPAPYFAAAHGTTAIDILAIENPLTTPVLKTAKVTVAAWDPPSDPAPNLGGEGIWVLDGRLINVHWRDGNLYTAHAISLSDDKNVARWYQFRTNGWPAGGKPTLFTGGNINPGGQIHTYYPAIYSNERDAVAIVMARSSPTEFASIQITGRRADDPLGSLGALVELQSGTSGYTGWRWGDYFDICVDPVDDNTFWAVGEYATGSGTWNTWIASFVVTPVLGDLNCDGTLDAFDVDPFVLALTNPVAYSAAYPDCDLTAADVNEDGQINAFDVDPFVARLTGG